MTRFLTVTNKRGEKRLVRVVAKRRMTHYLHNVSFKQEVMNMFINNKSDRRAFLLSHDNGEVVYSAAPLEDDKPKHTVPADAFFAEHREANREEIEDYYDKREDDAPAPKLHIGKGRKTAAAPAEGEAAEAE